MSRTAAVIVPTRDRAELVVPLVRSLLTEQTSIGFDVVVVDDGSTDTTQADLGTLLASLHPSVAGRVRLVASEHGGVARARNLGVAHTESPWLVFLDSDDEPDAGWAAALLRECDDDHDLVSVGLRRRAPDGTTTVIAPSDPGPAFGGVRALWQAGAFAIRRSLFDEVGGYRDGLAFSENTDLALRIAARHEQRPVRSACDPSPRYTVHVRAGRYDPAVQLASAEAMLEHHTSRLSREPELRANYEAIAGVAAHRLGDRRLARRHLRSAIRHRPLSVKHHTRFARTLLPRPRTGALE